MFGIDFIFLLVASGSLLLWFRFREGTTGKLFRGVFFISFIALITSVFLQYQGFPGMNWLMASGNAFLLAIASILIRITRSMKLPLVVSAIFLLALLLGGKAMIGNVGALAYSQKDYAQNGEVIAKLKADHSALAGDYEGVTIRRMIDTGDRPADDWDQYYILDLDCQSLAEIESVTERVADDPHIEFIEMNEVLKIEPQLEKETRQTPTTRFANDPAIINQWQYDILQYDELHLYLDSYKGKRYSAQLAILDSGVDAEHEDIKANYKTIESKYDQDDNGHGTHCASIAAGVTNNGLGTASLNVGQGYVHVSGVKVMNVFGFGSQERILKGIVDAIDAGADVISLSLGGRSTDRKQLAYSEAFAYAQEKNVIVIVAAGNNGGPSSDITPANAAGVICVSAVGDDLRMPAFANRIEDAPMGILAPGVSIYAAMPQNKYAALTGTSMAAPLISGLACLARTIDPQLTSEQFYKAMSDTGLNIAGGTLVQPLNVIKTIAESGPESLNERD